MDSIIFDVDGTLWDSTEICAKAWTDAIHRETDLSLTIDAPTLKGLFGRLLPDIASVLFADYPKEEQLRLIELCCQEEHKALLAQCAPLYPALEDTLRQLKKKYRLFIVSNCQAGYVGDTLGDFNATKDAGIPFVFASYGFGQVSSPDYTIQCPGDLLNIF